MLNQRGDTIIEVVLAFAVFSMVSIGAMTIMGQGSNTAQRALEITQVRQYIDSQAQALRAAQQAHTAAGGVATTEWRKIALTGAANDSQKYADETRCPVENDITGSFIMNPDNAAAVTTGSWFRDINAATAPPYAKVTTSSGVEAHGMWIERSFDEGGNGPDSFDFVVRACWFGAGLSTPLQLETSVRLYEPGS